MIIRRNQMEVFEDNAKGTFERRLAEHVRTRYAARPVGTSAGVFQVSDLYRSVEQVSRPVPAGLPTALLR